MHIGGTGFGHLGMSSRKWRSHSASSPHLSGHLGMSSRKWCSHFASSPHLSSAINSDSIVDLAIAVCFEDFHDTIAIPNVNA